MWSAGWGRMWTWRGFEEELSSPPQAILVRRSKLNSSRRCSLACEEFLRNSKGKESPPCGGDSGYFHSSGAE